MRTVLEIFRKPCKILYGDQERKVNCERVRRNNNRFTYIEAIGESKDLAEASMISVVLLIVSL